MTIFRTHVQTLQLDTLFILWDEIVEWEKKGSMPMDALLRQFTDTVLEEIDGGTGSSYALWMDFFAREVWRELVAKFVGLRRMEESMSA